MLIKNYILFILISFSFCAHTQNPVYWKINYDYSNQMISFSATIEKNWHLYATHVPFPNDGPLPTIFNFKESKRYILIDSIIQKKPEIKYDKNFGVDLAYYENSSFFKQKIEPLKNKLKISGLIEYMTCNESTCISFNFPFELKISPLN
jgi:thiol:disulfide interchange protein DsbD